MSSCWGLDETEIKNERKKLYGSGGKKTKWKKENSQNAKQRTEQSKRGKRGWEKKKKQTRLYLAVSCSIKSKIALQHLNLLNIAKLCTNIWLLIFVALFIIPCIRQFRFIFSNRWLPIADSHACYTNNMSKSPQQQHQHKWTIWHWIFRFRSRTNLCFNVFVYSWKLIKHSLAT